MQAGRRGGLGASLGALGTGPDISLSVTAVAFSGVPALSEPSANPLNTGQSLLSCKDAGQGGKQGGRASEEGLMCKEGERRVGGRNGSNFSV